MSLTEVLKPLYHLAEHRKYEELVRRLPGLWWEPYSPLAGLHRLNPLRLQYVQEVVELNGKRVLDVGCGGGIFAEAAARAGAKVVGVDPSVRSLHRADAHARGQGLEIEYAQGFAESLEFAEEFEIICAFHVLEHVDDLPQTLAACAKALKPGGFFFWLTYNQTLEAFKEIIWEAEYVHQRLPPGLHDFHRFIPPERLRELLTTCGITVQDMRGLGRDRSTSPPTLHLTDDLTVTYLGWGQKRKPMSF